MSIGLHYLRYLLDTGPDHPVSGSCQRFGLDTVANCHALHQTSTVGPLLPREAEQEAMCKSCHNPTGQAPTMDTEM